MSVHKVVVSVMRMLCASTLGAVTCVYVLLVSLETDSHVQQTKLQTLAVSIHGTHSFIINLHPTIMAVYVCSPVEVSDDDEDTVTGTRNSRRRSRRRGNAADNERLCPDDNRDTTHRTEGTTSHSTRGSTSSRS